jgi:RimJ/RimL family protein N-acetyltransferase
MLKIRKHFKKDIALRVKWLNNPKATRYALENPKKKTNIKEQTIWFNNYLKDKNKKFFTIFHDNTAIGFMGFSKINKKVGMADIFIMIGEDEYRRKGLGSEALIIHLLEYGFKKLKLKTINLEVNKKNKPAIKLYKKAGFKIKDINVSEISMNLYKKTKSKKRSKIKAREIISRLA